MRMREPGVYTKNPDCLPPPALPNNRYVCTTDYIHIYYIYTLYNIHVIGGTYYYYYYLYICIFLPIHYYLYCTVQTCS